MNKKLEQLKEQVSSVPQLPGVYLWKNSDGEVIYVGKAKLLRSRMRQYLNFQDERAKIPMLVSQIDMFDYIVCENENESLILEKNLIDQYKPFFNVDFKDDKTYPFIALTYDSKYPSIKYTREKRKSGVKYFGPYTNGRAARKMVEIVRQVVPICSSTCNEWKKIDRKTSKSSKNNNEYIYEFINNTNKPCFDCSVGISPGICCGKCTRDQYMKNVEMADKFLSGHTKEIEDSLKEKIQIYSESLEFEKANRYKKRLDTIHALSDSQHIILDQKLNIDIIGFCREETICGVHVLIIRDGKIINSNEFVLNKGKDVLMCDLQHNFLLKYYSMSDSVGREIVVRESFEGDNSLLDWLSKKLNSSHGAKVKFTIPKRGDKLELLKMSEINAKHTLLRSKIKSGYDDKRINDALLQLESALALPRPPLRIECFDISTNHGTFTVASMVVFVNGKPDKSQYRRFKIKTKLDEANDFVSMQEVLTRRYCEDRLNDKKFANSRPDLVILDGGKPQLSAACEIFENNNISDISLVGLAKRDEELFVTWNKGQPVILPDGSASLYLVKNIRDEAHRFAITFHRNLRNKAQSKSILDEVWGLGPVKKKQILKAFKGFKNLKAASLEQIIETNILSKEVAKELYIVLNQYK